MKTKLKRQWVAYLRLDDKVLELYLTYKSDRENRGDYLMSKILIDIKDQSKKGIVISLLKEFSFLEFHELDKNDKLNKPSDLRKLFGIWKEREINLSDLRTKAWKREIQ